MKQCDIINVDMLRLYMEINKNLTNNQIPETSTVPDKANTQEKSKPLSVEGSPISPVLGPPVPVKENLPCPSSDIQKNQESVNSNAKKMVESVADQSHSSTANLDPNFVCDEETYNQNLNLLNQLQEQTENFDVPAHIRGEKGQSPEEGPLQQNKEILTSVTDSLKTQAHELVDNGKVTDLAMAYKKLVGSVDKYDEQSKRQFLETGDPPKSTYALRTAILKASHSEGVGLDSWCVYTKGGKPGGHNIWPFLENGKNWVPEAQGARAKWIESTVVRTTSLSRIQKQNSVVLLKGGFGAGKTRLINEKFGEQGSGAIAPDKAKEIDRRSSPELPHSAAHIHGSQAAYELMNEMIKKQEGTIVYDSSLSNPADISKYLQQCKDAGKKMVIYDVARNDMARALSVLKRPVDGEDPRIPPDFIIRSAINDKVNRVKCMEVVLKDTTENSTIQPEYHFIGGDKQGWNTEEVMVLGPNGKMELKEHAEERLLLEGIEIHAEKKGLSLTINRESLTQQYNEQFERPVRDIKSELSNEEQTTLEVFSKRSFNIDPENNIQNATELYLALPANVQEAIPQKAFEGAFNSISEDTRKDFFDSIQNKSHFSYEDLPLRVALSIHQNLKTDPWK